MLTALMAALVFLYFSQKDDLLRALRSANLDRYIIAVRDLQKSPELLKDPVLQDAVITLFKRESSNPQWSERAEFVQYEAYYESLMELVQKIATDSNRKAAWIALASGNYNDDSRFARWMAQQPAVFSILSDLANDSDPTNKGPAKTASAPANEIIRKNVTFVLAETCTLTGQHCGQIRLLLRAGLQNKSDWVKLSSVRGLGLCGLPADIQLLHDMEPSYQGRVNWLHFLQESQAQIRGRL